MNTNNEVFSLFLNDKIYITQERNDLKNALPNMEINTSKKTIYVVEWSEKMEEDKRYVELITKMNTAIKYLPEEMQIIYLKRESPVKILALKEIYNCELVAIFGNFIHPANAQMDFPLNKVMIINGVHVIQTNPIQEIYEQAALKTSYWNALKTILV